MTQTAFLDAIAAEPDDLTHRLVYADWLDDHGDEADCVRAAFIRAQIERSLLPAYHPRARALLREETVMLEMHAQSWSADIAPLVRRCLFHRGFVEEVRISTEQLISHGRELFDRTPLRRVQLRGTFGLPALLARAEENADILADVLGRLHTLDLNRDYIGEAAGLALLHLPSLPRLTGLHLAHNALSPAGISVLASSSVLTGLETLEFTASSSSAEALQTLLHSPELRKLTSLSLAGSHLGDRICRMLAASPLMPRLRSLSLSHNQVTARGLRDLLESGAAGNLESLELSFNPLGSDGVRVLERSSALGQLRQLNVSRIEMGEEGVRVLASGTLLGRLEALDLSLNRLDAQAGFLLARYGPASRLLSLDLIYNALGTEAMAAVEERFGEDVCLFRR